VNLTTRETILNVDDNEPSLYAKTRILRRAGFEVLEASDGLTALRLVTAEMPQLVLLDVRLPDISGPEVCRRIKSNPPTMRIPVLHISATNTSEADQQVGMESGADIYLVEPLAPEELITVVRTLLRLRQTEAGLAASEERLRLATQSAGLGTCDIDLRTGKAVMSAAMFEILGLPASDCASMAAWTNRIHPDDRDATIAAFEAAQQANAHFRHEHRILRETDRDERWIAATGLFHPDETGRRTRFIGVMLDVTDRRRADVERNELLARESEARQVAEDAARLKDQFLATLSHELRTPMSAVLGWLHLLRTGRLSPEQQAHALETIERNARLQNELINDLLDVSRIITGRLRLDRDRVYPSVIVESAVDAVRPQAAARGIAIGVTAPQTLVTVFGDPTRLQQVVTNVLVNAIKFSRDGSSIDVAMHVLDGVVQITVADRGEGIEPDVLPFIFERFRQADGSITRRHGGMGLGLAIARHILDLHAGTISAHSEGRGHGATFTITLPADVERDASRTYPSAVEVPADAPAGRLAGIHALTVDDDANALSMLASMLELGGARVTTADSADEAMRVFAAHEDIRVVLSDIGMPARDGYDFIASLRREHPARSGDVAAIAVSGYARDEDHARALRAGFDAHLAKPFGMNALFDLIVRLVSERNAVARRIGADLKR
jgi:PAS domain S-box-containing protein